jgi:lysophospholipase L1-like esterase
LENCGKAQSDEDSNLKIVALGDSLTVGEDEFDLDSNEHSTFPDHLETLAQRYLNHGRSEMNVKVMNRGVCGDLTSGMLERFSANVVAEEADYVIILGGTNDIGWRMDSATIAHNLSSMYDAALNEGIGPVACAIPSILGFDELIPPRIQLNNMIRAEANQRGMPYVDLFTATADPHTHRLSEEYSADGLHLNGRGYQRVGQCIFDTWLKELLELNQRTLRQ